MQRFRCTRCNQSFCEEQTLPGVRIETKQAAQVVHMLCESMGVRAVSRITGLDSGTVLNVLESAGAKCEALLDAKLRNLPIQHLEIDELWAKVSCRQKLVEFGDMERGDFYTFLALCAQSKLIAWHHTGKRNRESTETFIESLASRIVGRPQITTDGWYLYPPLLQKYFYLRMDYATLTKIFKTDTSEKDAARRYSPPVCTSIRLQVEAGRPKSGHICTSHVERVNLSVRTFNRRFTRLSLNYSKKLSNHRYAVALFVAHYNFCRVHSAHGKTPAHAAGITDHTWTVEELITAV